MSHEEEGSIVPLGRHENLAVVTVEGGPIYFDVPEWVGQSLCAQVDPELFYPEKGGSTREAKKVCMACTVRAECLTYALDHKERFGIWGSLSERERRAMDRTHVA